MNFDLFVKESGFKVLSMAGLSQCEYSIIFYFLNCASSGLDDLIISDKELASFTGFDQKLIETSLDSLIQKNILKLKTIKDSTLYSIEYDIKKWIIQDKELSHKEAIVYPFRYKGMANSLKVVSSKESKVKKEINVDEQIFNIFTEDKTLSEEEISVIKQDIKILLNTYPADQILALVKYFKHKLPSLSLLASAWQHFIEIYEMENQTVNMNEAKKKQESLDNLVRERVSDILENKYSSNNIDKKVNYTSDEISVLKMILNHKFPRRQLFWAYQARNNYPNLKEFLEENKSLMLAVTNKGKTLK